MHLLRSHPLPKFYEPDSLGFTLRCCLNSAGLLLAAFCIIWSKSSISEFFFAWSAIKINENVGYVKSYPVVNVQQAARDDGVQENIMSRYDVIQIPSLMNLIPQLIPRAFQHLHAHKHVCWHNISKLISKTYTDFISGL